MAPFPETRDSLLLKVRDPANVEAWEAFVATYRPVIYRLARKFGLQDADAEDLAQRVLLSVSEAIQTWEKDERRGTFRAWLLRVARNAIINALTRTPPDAAVGGTGFLEHLQVAAVRNRIPVCRRSPQRFLAKKRWTIASLSHPTRVRVRPTYKSTVKETPGDNVIHRG